MSTNANRSRTQTYASNAVSWVVLAPALDVPGLLADRIGDLYAAEERSDRAQRTERMILKAQNLK